MDYYNVEWDVKLYSVAYSAIRERIPYRPIPGITPGPITKQYRNGKELQPGGRGAAETISWRQLAWTRADRLGGVLS